MALCLKILAKCYPMKQAALIFNILLIALLFASCATTQNARAYRKAIHGTWQLETIVSEGVTSKLNSQLFNEAQFDCFIGSNWQFNNNNSLGTYSILSNANECAAVKRNLRWSVYEATDQPKLLQFKRLDEKLNEIDANSGGFRFIITHLDKTRMSVRSDLSFEGKPAAIIYNFKKT